MNHITLIYVNSFAILVLVLTLRNYRQKFKYICCEEKVFIFFIAATMAILTIEPILQTLWRREGQTIRILLYVIQTIDFSLTIIITVLWLYYCLLRIYSISKVSRLLRFLIAVPAALYIILLIAAVPTGIAFSISETNEYHRGAAYIGDFVVGYTYIAAAFILILVKRHTLKQDELFPYLLVPLIPITVGIVEMIFGQPIDLVWAATSLVILGIQMFILNNRTNIDHLTGLNNRMALDNYVKNCIHECHASKEPFGLIMIDIDSFKKINDDYGHVEGDRALKATADILRECFSGNHFIARYGGDEFTVAVKGCSRELMREYLDKLETERTRQNRHAHKPYEINFSIGATVFRETEITDAHTMFMQVDKMMYENKSTKKKQPREA